MCTPIHPLIHEVEPKIQNDDLHLCSFMLYRCHGGRKNGEILKNNLV